MSTPGISEATIDGPLLLTLLLTNQNNNDAAATATPIADTLDPRSIALEAKSVTPTQKEKTTDGHMFYTQMLTNINNKNGSGTNPCPDTLAPRVVAVEAGVEQSVPLVLRLRGQQAERKNGQLSQEQLQFWKDNGYLVIPGALSIDTVSGLIDNVNEMAENLFSPKHDVTVHSYLPGKEKYVSPIGRVLATLTKNAFSTNTHPLQRIERFGCGVHRILSPFRTAIFTPFHEEIAQSLSYRDPRVTQSLVIIKAAGVGEKIVPHQDGCSNFTDPPSCTTFWYALEDATSENGCLAVAPGSHRSEPITRRCRHNGNGKAEFVKLDEPVYAVIDGCSASEAALPLRGPTGEYVYEKLEVKAGTLVLMHGNLMHTSEANRSAKGRIAFNFGIVEGGLEWCGDNYLQPYDGETEFEKLAALG